MTYKRRSFSTARHVVSRPLARQLHRIAAITRFLMYLPSRSIPAGTSRRSCAGRRYNSLSRASDATRLTFSYFVSSSPRGRVSTTPSAACRPIISDARVIATTPTDWPADRLDEQVGRCEGPAGERLLATVMTTTSSQLQQQRNDFYHGL